MINDNEKHLFFNALMFYTRIPVPTDTPYSPALLNQSRKYFTVIGLIIGGIACVSYLLAQLFMPTSLAVLLSMIASILATGAFHEDGFADTCDALGGGWTTEQVLTIMKDSRIGTYGTVGLIGILAGKYSALLQLSQLTPTAWCLCVLAAHTTSRLHSSRLIEHYEYVQDIDKSKVKPIAAAALNHQAARFSLLVAIAPCLILSFYSFWSVLLGLALGYLASNKFMAYCKTRIGGYTGDVLGAIQQLTEVLFLFCCLVTF